MSAEKNNSHIGKRLAKYMLLGTAAAMLPISAVHAQTGDQSDAAEEDDNIIIVTATLRERSLQDIPLSVTALGGDALENAAVTNVESLQFSVPGLNITTSAGSGFQSSVRIRGVGTSSTNIGFEGSVGIFVDGIYRPRAGTSLGDFADVERIEVLRGAQSTLFGRNTTAGAISVITKKPELDEFSGSARATVGNFDRLQLRGIVNVPIIQDEMAFRFSADYNKRDGFLQNLIPGVGDLNDRDRINLRGQLLFQPTPDLSFRFIATYFSADESCCGATVFNDGGFVTAGNAGLLAPVGITSPVAPDESRFDDFLTARDFPTRDDQEEIGVQVDIDWQINDSINWFTQLSYSDYENIAFSDQDQTAIDFTIVDPNNPNMVTQEQFTIETRLSGEIGDSFNWITGLYYSNEKLGQDFDLTFGTGATGINALLSGVAPGFPPFGFTAGDNQQSILRQDTDVFSAFGQLDFDITDRFNITGGLRYTSERKNGTGEFTTAIGPLFNPFILPGASTFDADQDADELTGSVSLAYKFTDDVSIYGSYTRGYKSGGINLDVLGGQAGYDAGSPGALVGNGFANANAIVLDPTFPEETVEAFEVGLRSQFWDRRATFNLTGFYSVFTNFQLLQFTGVSFNSVAAPEVITKGIEAEFKLNPVEGLNINAQYTYADAFYSADFPLLGFVDGQTINNAPEHSASVNVNYSTPIGSNFKGFVNGGWFYNSSYNASSGLQPTRVQGGFSKFNGRIGFSTENESIGLELWCRNCFDKAAAQIIFSSPIVDDSEFAFMQAPMEWGLTLTTRF